MPNCIKLFNKIILINVYGVDIVIFLNNKVFNHVSNGLLLCTQFSHWHSKTMVCRNFTRNEEWDFYEDFKRCYNSKLIKKVVQLHNDLS